MLSHLLLLAACAITAAAAAAPAPAEVLAAAKEAHPWIVGLRRELHAIPELGSNELKTSALIKSTLTDLGIPFTCGPPQARSRPPYPASNLWCA